MYLAYPLRVEAQLAQSRRRALALQPEPLRALRLLLCLNTKGNAPFRVRGVKCGKTRVDLNERARKTSFLTYLLLVLEPLRPHVLVAPELGGAGLKLSVVVWGKEWMDVWDVWWLSIVCMDEWTKQARERERDAHERAHARTSILARSSSLLRSMPT